VTIVNGINNEQVGRIIKFALDNPRKSASSPSAVSFTAETSRNRRPQDAQRYTLSHLAHDVKNQTGLGEPSRDWFPISSWALQRLGRLMHVEDKNKTGPTLLRLSSELRTGMAVMIDKETKEAVRLLRSLRGSAREGYCAGQRCGSRKFLTIVGMALCLMKNYDPFQSPTHFKLTDLLKKFDKNFNATGKNYGKVGRIGHRRRDEAAAGRWNFLFIAGLVPGSVSTTTSGGRSSASFLTLPRKARSRSAPTTRRGWRTSSRMHMTATLTKCTRSMGGMKSLPGQEGQPRNAAHSLVLKDELVTNEEQHDLDTLGIAKNAREEKLRARDEKQKNDPAYNARMASLYRKSC